MIKQRINALRELMSKENISVYIVTSADYNQSAYVGGYFKLREFLTGFTGSNGTLVLTCDKAVLYTDSRYYLQAAQELLGSGIELFKAGEKETPEITDFITDNVPYGGTAAGDGRTFSASFADTLSLKLAKKNARLLYDCDLGGALWIEGRPEMPKEKAIIHDIKYAGVSAEEKIQWLRDEIKKLGADAHLITALDDIAWLLNIRGNDIHCLPAVLSYVFISQDELLLFVDADKITGAVKTHLLLLGVKVLPYDCIYDFLKNYNGSCKMLLLHRKKVNYRLCRAAMCRFDIIDRMNPTTLKKAIKNETEILNARRAHICDGKAVCEVIAYLKKNVAKNKITEMDVARMLSKHRREAGAVDDSFNAICGYAEHGAIVHYSANEKTNKQLEPRGLLLMDSGGQYKEGTTDVTRTVALGGMTAFERKCFTLVLKGMLALGEVKFKKGLTGANLDIIGRVPLYEHGLDYGHATGHGVGSFLSVHEYPNGFSAVNDCVFEAGMITSDEPGVYIEGQFGVRIENLMLCKEDDDGFLKFEFLTMVPIDKEAIDFSLMNDEDIHRLNEYHAMVRKNILPVISDEAREYLINATEEI